MEWLYFISGAALGIGLTMFATGILRRLYSRWFTKYGRLKAYEQRLRDRIERIEKTRETRRAIVNLEVRIAAGEQELAERAFKDPGSFLDSWR